MIYEPEEDSFLLKYQIEKFVEKGTKVLDMGTGSGILAQEAKECGGKVLAADINPDAIKLCKTMGIKAVISDLFENIPKNTKYDLIIFNPPYLPRDELEDEESAVITSGGEKGNEIIEKFLKQAKNFLSKKGKLLFLVSSLTPETENILKENGYTFEKVSEKNIFFEKLIVYSAWVQE